MAGTLKVDAINASTGVLATQNGMTGIAKAWVYYGGTSQTIKGSFNVSSVTYISAGRYTVNFTTVMPNANYATGLSQARTAGSADYGFMGTYSQTTSSISIAVGNLADSAIDFDNVSVTVFSS